MNLLKKEEQQQEQEHEEEQVSLITDNEIKFIEIIKSNIKLKADYFYQLANSHNYENEFLVMDLKNQYNAYDNINLFIDLMIDNVLKEREQQQSTLKKQVVKDSSKTVVIKNRKGK